MQTFIEMLRKEFDKQPDVKYSDEQLAGIDAFMHFAKEYLGKNRPTGISHATDANYIVSLQSRESFLICPEVVSKRLPNQVAQVTGVDHSGSVFQPDQVARVTRPKT